MKTLIGGAVAAALGLIGIVIWWGAFLMVIKGTIPVMLLLGGGLAIYLGFDELKDTWKDETVDTGSVEKSEDVEKYKKEIDGLKEEIKTMKKD
ncbi:MAG: hypothetical protein JRD71_11655 [Deltaproteobacteria bacterium]|nr:hypothetical protein [Deltaproteobacteria bacterium]